MKLYQLSEIEQFQRDLPYLIEITEWVKDFLGNPHPDLGRPGPVCPFVPQSLKSNNLQLAVIRPQKLETKQIEEIVFLYRDIFLKIEPRVGQAALNKAIILIFPDVHIDDTSRLIDSVQQKLKPFFVEQGLMLGEFHNRTESPGLHNPNFRPLRSPIPLLAIRHMVESDLPFLQATDDLGLRIRFLLAYLQLFDQDGKDSLNLSHARRLLALTRDQLEQENSLLVSPVAHTSTLESSVASCPYASRLYSTANSYL